MEVIVGEYANTKDLEDDAVVLADEGWRPVSLSTTLSRNLFWYLTLGMGPRDTVYHLLYVRD